MNRNRSAELLLGANPLYFNEPGGSPALRFMESKEQVHFLAEYSLYRSATFP
jgi:hypothetical protein